MKQFFEQYDVNILLPLGIVAAGAVAGLAIRWLIRNSLGRLAGRTRGEYDDIVVAVLTRISVPLSVIAAAFLAFDSAPYAAAVMPYLRPVILAAVVLVLVRAAVMLLIGAIKVRADTSGGTLAVTSLTRKIVQIVVYIIGGITILSFFGISITPIVTALGVGGLAVALALQDTLSNMFAGVYITLANQIRVGDYIKLENNLEGFVVDIGWRNTSIKPFDENLVIIPNNKLSQSIITNYFLPLPAVRAKVEVRVDYRSDPGHVERVLYSIVNEYGHDDPAEAAREDQPSDKIRGLLRIPEPVVRFSMFGDSALNFFMSFSVIDFQHQGPARHEIMKKVFYRFREEDINIPFPIRTLHLGDEQVLKALGKEGEKGKG